MTDYCPELNASKLTPGEIWESEHSRISQLDTVKGKNKTNESKIILTYGNIPLSVLFAELSKGEVF